MKKISLTIIFFFLIGGVFSQKFEWARAFGSAQMEEGISISIDPLGCIYTMGVFSDQVDFDPSGSFSILSSNGMTDIYITKLTPEGNLLWAKNIGGLYAERPKKIVTDQLGNIYVAGYFSDTVDFDPGIAVFNLVASGRDGFVCKIDTNGDFLWAKKIGGVDMDYIHSISIDSGGNLIVGGSFRGSVNFESNTLTSTGMESCFVLKMDGFGNVIWAKKYGKALTKSYDIVTDALNNIFITGSFVGTIDVDPGAGIFNIIAVGGEDVYVSKLDDNGNFLWGKTFGGAGDDIGYGIDVDTFGNVYTTGQYYSTVDFDPGAGVYNLPFVSGASDIYIHKLDSLGNFVWARSLGGTGGFDIGMSISVDLAGFVYSTGQFSGTMDFDPGIGVFNLTTNLYNDIYLSKLDQNGNFVWAKAFTGAGQGYNDIGNKVIVDEFQNIFLTGYFGGTINCSPSVFGSIQLNAIGDGDVFVCKINQDSCSSVSIVLDSVINLSCQFGQGYSEAHVLSGRPPYFYSWSTNPFVNDSATYFSLPGIYSISIIDANRCTRTSDIIISGPNSISYDLKPNLISAPFQIGQNTRVQLNCINEGCVPVSGNLKIIIDPSTDYLSSTPVPDSINGDTLTWNFINLVYDSVFTVPFLTLSTPIRTSGMNNVCLEIIASPMIGDTDTTNNARQYCFPVSNEYEPSDKNVYPIGSCSPGYIDNDQLLTYTVRFQNVGNASAIDVYILDTLDVDLNLNTVRIIGNSHPLITEILPGNVLKFRFDNINLADSASNEAASHGYVIFEILPNTGLANATTIKNMAGIYFDYNPPFYTNTVFNTISDGTINTNVSIAGNIITADLPNVSYQWLDCVDDHSIIALENNQTYTSVTSGVYAVIVSDGCLTDTSVCVSIFVTGISEPENSNQFSFYPNPSNNSITITTNEPTYIKIINMLGEAVIEKQVQNNFVIDINDLSNGIYFIQTKEGYSTKLIKN